MGDVTAGYDLIVIGSGIAGTAAAIEAARAGARVALASLGATFSGSSFFGGTWGLGLIGPEDDADADDLMHTIQHVGCHQADPRLVEALVHGISPAIHWLEELGVELRRPTDATQQAYIPCFDHKTRAWYGLVRDSLRPVWAHELEHLDVTLLPHTELVDFAETEGQVSAALLFDHQRARLAWMPCSTLVLATGGLAGLYARRLTADDTCGSAHGIALSHGCSLINAEFLQMMPGLVSPLTGIVVNEKAFRYATLPFSAELLAERSGYGPFTTRLAARQIDLAIAAAGSAGMPLSYRLPDDPPELVADYFTWLEQAYGLRPQDEVRIALYAHASNGGIRIAPDTACVGGPAGLFACGECAGGMHGADRLGGLASASALVFGRRAGTEAARRAAGGRPTTTPDLPALPGTPAADAILARLRDTMSMQAMVGRTGEGLATALDTMDELDRQLRDSAHPHAELRQGVITARTSHQLRAAQTMLCAMRQRSKSCGSHHRADEQA